MMKDLAKTDLPVGWVNITVGDAVISISTNGKKIRQKEYAEQGRYAVVDQGQEHIGGYTDDEEKLVNCQLPVIVFGDHTRVIKYVNRPFAAGADGIKVLQPHEFITPKFLEYSLRHCSECMTSKGYARHYQHLAKSFLSIPPHPEQHRIVAKIEELFSELDKGIESLKTAREQLKVYRQALLKHAFEGALTEKWREENHVGAGSKPALGANVNNGRVTDRAPTKRRKDIPSLTSEELAELPELPLGWGWVKLGNACSESILGKMLDKEKNKGTLKPYLRNINVRWSSFDLHNLLEMRFEDSEQDRFCLADGDLVICEGGEPGRCAVWRNKYGIEIRIQKALHRVRFTSSIKPDYVQKYFELYSANNKIEKYFTGTTIKHLTGEGLSKIPLPICPANEQIEILRIIDEKISATDQLDQTIITALQQSETLRQSILKKAFSGQLVSQDPHDEPASVLLERIMAERNVQGKSSKRHKSAPIRHKTTN